MVPDVGIELTTYRLQGGCSTTELIRRSFYLTATIIYLTNLESQVSWRYFN